MHHVGRKLWAVCMVAAVMAGYMSAAIYASEPVAAILGASSMQVLADNGLSFDGRRAEIEQRWSELQPRFSSANIYEAEPRAAYPYEAGKLREAYLQDAVNSVNFARFLAGMADDIELYDGYTTLSQYGAVLSSVSERGHTPPQPADMQDDFYQTAMAGLTGGNLYYGTKTLSHAVLNVWMADNSDNNLARVGHRRWILNPQMQYTGFGQATSRGVMYAHDASRRFYIDYDAVCYPGGAAFPSDFFEGSYPWSITVNPSQYQTPSREKVKVVLTEQSTGRTWEFMQGGSTHFSIDTTARGTGNAIIFRPGGISSYSGTYSVSVDGLADKAGNPVSLDYQVTFFKLGDGGSTPDPTQPTGTDPTEPTTGPGPEPTAPTTDPGTDPTETTTAPGATDPTEPGTIPGSGSSAGGSGTTSAATVRRSSSGSGGSGSSGARSGASTRPRLTGDSAGVEQVGDYSWRVELPRLGFQDAYADGDILERGEDYTLKSGSTVLTLKDSYVDALKAGEHRLYMEFISTDVYIDFTVERATRASATRDSGGNIRSRDVDEPVSTGAGGGGTQNPSTGMDPQLWKLLNYDLSLDFLRRWGVCLTLGMAALAVWALMPRKGDEITRRLDKR